MQGAGALHGLWGRAGAEGPGVGRRQEPWL